MLRVLSSSFPHQPGSHDVSFSLTFLTNAQTNGKTVTQVMLHLGMTLSLSHNHQAHTSVKDRQRGKRLSHHERHENKSD